MIKLNLLQSISLICLIQLSLTSFNSVDQILDSQRLADININGSQWQYRAELVAFPDNTFGQIYLQGATPAPFVMKFKNGQPLTGFPTLAVGTGAIHGASLCAYNDEAVAVYSTNGNASPLYRAYLRIIRSDGTFRTNIIRIPNTLSNNSLFVKCHQIQNNLLAFSYGKETGSAWDGYVNTYNPETDTWGTTETTVNTQTAGQQTFVSFAKISPTSFMTAQSGDGTETTGGSYGIYLQSWDQNLQKTTVSDSHIAGSGTTTGVVYLDIKAINTNQVIISWQGDNSRVYFAVHQTDYTQVCAPTELSTNSLFPKIVTHNQIPYIGYIVQGSPMLIQVDEIDVGNCQSAITDIVYSGQNIETKSLSMAISKASTSPFTTVAVVSFYIRGTVNDVVISEYFFDQKDNSNIDVQCPSDSNCLACYGTYTCPVCRGTGIEERQIRERPDGSCTCRNGYFHLDSEINCQKCSKFCETCSGSATNCDSCKYTDPNLLPVNQCTCKPGWVWGPLNSCIECDNTCVSTCTDTELNCDTCIDTYVKIVDKCLSCNAPCKHCTTDQDTCTLCHDGWYKHGNTCIICPHPFSKCTDSNTPTECKTGTGRLGTTDYCKCESGHFEQSPENSNCGICTYPCQNCSSSSTHCESCVSANRNEGNNTCACLDTYYEETNLCKKCQFPCLNCDSLSNCIGTCAGQATLRTSPTCDCISGYYELSQNCIQCPNKYKKCENETTPTECHSDALGRSTSLPCTCTTGYYDDNSSKNCLRCNTRCKTCETDADNCLECHTNDPHLIPSDICTCEPGWIDNSANGCEKCESPCNTCSGSKTTCIDCMPGFYKTGFTCTQCPHPFINCDNVTTPTLCKSGTGRLSKQDLCKCAPGFFEKPTESNDCGLCQYPCTSCSNSPTNCTNCNDRVCATCIPNSNTCIETCNTGCLRCNEDRTCKSCKLGQILNISLGTCESCHPKCSICEKTDKNTCIQCNPDAEGRDENCACKDGYYEEENQANCVKCSVNLCKKCDSQDQCIDCLDSSLLPPLCERISDSQYGVVIINPNGEQQRQIQTCSSKCSKCTQSEDNCLQCVSGFKRQVITPLCDCESGYHDNNGTQKDCEQCPVLCKICASNDNCSECEQNSVLNDYTGLCECKFGFKLDEKTQNCIKCYNYRGKCIFNCPNNTNQDENSQTCQITDYQANSYLLLIYICGLAIIVSIFFQILINTLSSKIRKNFSKKKENQNPTILNENQ